MWLNIEASHIVFMHFKSRSPSVSRLMRLPKQLLVPGDLIMSSGTSESPDAIMFRLSPAAGSEIIFTFHLAGLGCCKWRTAPQGGVMEDVGLRGAVMGSCGLREQLILVHSTAA